MRGEDKQGKRSEPSAASGTAEEMFVRAVSIEASKTAMSGEEEGGAKRNAVPVDEDKLGGETLS